VAVESRMGEIAGGEAGRGITKPRRGRVGTANETRILRAAEEIFAERGFSGATTAAIAERAGIAKANVHYYFGTKETLYREVLRGILALWLDATDTIVEGADPATALANYIREKVSYSRTRPIASKVFANELLHGAPQIKDFLKGELKDKVERKAKIIRGWIAAGKMAPVDPVHLFFVIWAATQTYADFDVQVASVLGRKQLGRADFTAAAETVTQLVLRGCGLAPVETLSRLRERAG
jgi:TetR/AcrR family transcriptional regulator